MDKLNTLVEKSLQIAEKGMKASGYCNPKVVVFFRDLNNELGTYMIDLAPKKYFDSRLDIMENIGTTLHKFVEEGNAIRDIDLAVAYGEAHITTDKTKQHVLMASAMDQNKLSVTRFKEVRHSMMPEHPERQMLELKDLEVKTKYESPMLTKLFDSFIKTN